MLVKTALEVVEGPSCTLNSSKGVGSFQDGSVLVSHQFREPVCFKLVNTGLDIDGNKVLDEGHLLQGLLPCLELGALGPGSTIDRPLLVGNVFQNIQEVAVIGIYQAPYLLQDILAISLVRHLVEELSPCCR